MDSLSCNDAQDPPIRRHGRNAGKRSRAKWREIVSDYVDKQFLCATGTQHITGTRRPPPASSTRCPKGEESTVHQSQPLPPELLFPEFFKDHGIPCDPAIAHCALRKHFPTDAIKMSDPLLIKLINDFGQNDCACRVDLSNQLVVNFYWEALIQHKQNSLAYPLDNVYTEGAVTPHPIISPETYMQLKQLCKESIETREKFLIDWCDCIHNKKMDLDRVYKYVQSYYYKDRKICTVELTKLLS